MLIAMPPQPPQPPNHPTACLQVRALVRGEMTTALAKYDALITPTAPTPAYKLGEKSSDPLEVGSEAERLMGVRAQG